MGVAPPGAWSRLTGGLGSARGTRPRGAWLWGVGVAFASGACRLGACPAERARAAPRSRHFPRGRRCRRGRSCPVRAAAGAVGRDDERQRGAKLRRAGNTRSPSALRGRAPLPPLFTHPHLLRVAPAPPRPPVFPPCNPVSLFSGGGASAAAERRVRRRGGGNGGGAAPRVRCPAPSWAGTARAREGQNGGPEPSGAPRPPSHPCGRGILLLSSHQSRLAPHS